MWWYAALQVVVTGLVGTSLHVWGGLPWYEGLMGALLVGALVIVAVHEWHEHLQTWREITDIFRRK
jgi:hypothetical protein